MNKRFVISLDAMSGDLGAEVVVRAAVASLERHAELELLLVGKETELTELLERNHAPFELDPAVVDGPNTNPYGSASRS